MNMEIKTYRASTMQEALRLVRSDLGPDAAVLHTREVPLSRLFGWLPGMRRIEVTASTDVVVPSRFPEHGDEARPASQVCRARRPTAMPTLPRPTWPVSWPNCNRWSRIFAAAAAAPASRTCPIRCSASTPN